VFSQFYFYEKSPDKNGVFFQAKLKIYEMPHGCAEDSTEQQGR